jgi:hemoglobin-like flavoprotein
LTALVTALPPPAEGPFLHEGVMDIQESLHQVLQHKDVFGRLFYDTFFDRCPEARRFFAHVNLGQQALLLTIALKVVEAHYTNDYPTTALYLQYLGHKHHTRQVPPELYPPFRDALLAALEQFHGGDWDATAARQWREAIERATERMLLGYQEPLHV